MKKARPVVAHRPGLARKPGQGLSLPMWILHDFLPMVFGASATYAVATLAGLWKQARDEARKPGDEALKAPHVVDDAPGLGDGYEPTAADLAEYGRWLADHDEVSRECARDYGGQCDACDRADELEAAAMVRERDELAEVMGDGDGWYLDLVARAANPHTGWRD